MSENKRTSDPTDIHSQFNACMYRGYCKTIENQRDELLAALEKVTAKLAWLNSDDCGHIMALTDEAEALIASVKGGGA